jgi:hypothetical protein
MLSAKYLWGAALVASLTACGPSDSDSDGGGTGTGGMAAGGTASGGAATGGAATGGSASGGAATGGGASGGAATGGSGGTDTPSKTGQVMYLRRLTGDGLNATFSDGSSSGGAQQECVSVESGSCYARTCGEAPGGVPTGSTRPDAGTVTFTITGIAGSATATPDGTGFYTTGTDTFEETFGGGEQALFAASGGEVPAFQQAVEIPLTLLLTQPAYQKDVPQVVPRGSDLNLTWLRGTEGVWFYVQSSSQRPDGLPGSVTVNCTFESTAGTGVIASSVLQSLVPGAKLLMMTIRNTPITAGEYDVSLYTGLPTYNEAKDQIANPTVE